MKSLVLEVYPVSLDSTRAWDIGGGWFVGSREDMLKFMRRLYPGYLILVHSEPKLANKK